MNTPIELASVNHEQKHEIEKEEQLECLEEIIEKLVDIKCRINAIDSVSGIESHLVDLFNEGKINDLVYLEEISTLLDFIERFLK